MTMQPLNLTTADHLMYIRMRCCARAVLCVLGHEKLLPICTFIACCIGCTQ